jgi:hypothetical protein
MITPNRLLPDQTLGSLVAQIWILNGLATYESAVTALFGSPVIKCDQVLFSGIRKCYESLSGAGYDSPRGLLDAHSYLNLYQPFAPEHSYESAITMILDDNTRSSHGLFRLAFFNPISSTYRYCEQCMQEELESHGFAYAHRSHQIVGVNFCHTHQIPLIEFDSEKGSATSKGLVSQRAFEHDTRNSITAPQTSNHHEVTFCQWVHSALIGNIPNLSDPTTKQLLFRNQLDRMPRISGHFRSHPGRLQQIISFIYSAEYLKTTELETNRGRYQNWPGLMMSSSLYNRHPLINLLVLNALFSSPEEISKDLVKAPDCVEDDSNPTEIFDVRQAMSLQLIKDLLATSDLNNIAKRYGVDGWTIRQWLRGLPEIKARRAARQLKKQIREAREYVRRFLFLNPEATVQRFRNSSRSRHDCLINHDKEWLLDIFSSIENRNEIDIAAREKIERIDLDTAKSIKLKAEQLYAGTFPERITESVLTTLLSKELRMKLRYELLPITKETIRSQIEGEKEFINRYKKVLNDLVDAGDIDRSFTLVEQLVRNNKKRHHLTRFSLNRLKTLATQNLENAP